MSGTATSRSGAELGVPFFDRSVHEVARELIGCTLEIGECAGVIVETEAYDQTDPACHAFGGRTARNEVLFGPPGRAYVYLSYGIHSLLNAVAEPEGSAAAVLIRALQPTAGVELMRERRRRSELHELCSGPGKLTEALGVGLDLNGLPLDAAPFRILAPPPGSPGPEVLAGPRIGITKAVDHPWRYCAAGSRHVSRPWPRSVEKART
ncbi:MAG TPA: DNA-3-methyladenine glycosylase [Solirubrobacterales bacterium]|nr:DNA-3-methyladenine glycosylase [Solirubrobacterales bacterium]